MRKQQLSSGRSGPSKSDVLCRVFQTLSFKQSRAKRVETLCLFQFFSFSDIFVFFSAPTYFSAVTAAKSTGKSCILNIEKGEGEINRIQCNFIENEE